MSKYKFIIGLVTIMWLVFIVNLIPSFELNTLGIKPRSVSGIPGILFAPFLHANIFHILSNTVPLLVLGFLLFSFYKEKAVQVIVYSIIIGGIFVWIFGRSDIHIGASGLIYAFAAFLISAGIFRKKIWDIIIAIIVIFLYGGLVWGLLPTQYFISWEGHLFGAIAGFILAYTFYKRST